MKRAGQAFMLLAIIFFTSAFLPIYQKPTEKDEHELAIAQLGITHSDDRNEHIKREFEKKLSSMAKHNYGLKTFLFAGSGVFLVCGSIFLSAWHIGSFLKRLEAT